MSIGSQLRGATFSSGAGSTDGNVGGEESLIDRSSAFDGVLRTARNLRVEGQTKGEVYCDGTLFVDEGGQVDARVVSANITVAGLLNGEVTCHGKLHILPTGRVTGRVATASLVIQEGAIYEGELRMSNIDEEPGPTVTVTTALPPENDDEIN
jgi:cytoskeletal protein CcmA (bactofilin family)